MARVFVPYAGYDGHSRVDKASGSLGPRQEEVLSYLIGLGPVGSPVEINRRTMMTDLGFKDHQPYYQAIQKLIAQRYIRRIATGCGGTTGVFVVLRRIG